MTALVETPRSSLDAIAAIAVYARSVDTTDELASLAARIRAARELVKAQDDVRDIRRMLMHAEVAVLLRRYDLADPKLTTWDKVAIRAFQRAGTEATHDFVEKHFEEFGKASQLGRALRDQQSSEDALSAGKNLARSPRDIAEWAERLAARDPDADELQDRLREAAREDVATMMRRLIDSYTYTGEPFTVEDVTDALIGRMGADTELIEDAAFRDGVRRVCREAVRAASVIEFEGERLPSTVAVETAHGWVRVPIGSSTPAHLAATIREREAQIARDRASVARFSRFLEMVTSAGCEEFEPIAGYLPVIAAQGARETETTTEAVGQP